MGKKATNPYKKIAEDAANAPLNVSTFLKRNKQKQEALQKAMEGGYYGK